MVYEGNGSYIFVSYSHRDAQKVIPIIDSLIDDGYRVWYDSGIEAGTEWPEYIEEHLINSEVVVAFMTPSAVESRNCRNEINFALELQKDILVVYLEDTTLLKGMRLQLNSTQSLFRKNHNSEETFIRELLDAQILLKCRDNEIERNNKPQNIVKQTTNNVTIIANVCCIGTNNSNDLWPKGTYSQIINRDEFSVVFFHINLLKPIGFSGTIILRKRIYNSANNLVFDNESSLEMKEEYDKISTGWILKGDDGSFIPSGEYRFVCSVNNSPEFTYSFTVVSDNELQIKKLKKKPFFNMFKELFKN